MSNEVDLRKQRKVSADVTIDPAGLATEAKQDAQIVLETAIRDYLDTVETKLASLITNTTGLSLEATQLLVKAKTDNLDVLLSSRASNAVALGIKAGTDNIPAVSQAIMDESMPVVIASDQSPVNVITDTATTQSTTTVSASATSVLLKALNVDRRQITITNTSTKKLWICFFTPATSVTPFFLSKDETWIFDNYTGAIYGIWDTGATGNAYITEESA